MYLGIDIGSSSSKAALIDDDKKLAAVSAINTGAGTDGIEQALSEVFAEAGIDRNDVRYSVVTGYGRINYEGADKQITEITCHAKGAVYLKADIGSIIDIGGQDAKVIRLKESGEVENFVMNEKCAAGTGRFLEVMARVLACGLSELSGLADRSEKEVPISSVCTVFAESEAISRLASGERIEDVAKGAHVAIAKRVSGMCSRVGVKSPVVMTGGVTLNENMVKTISEVLEMEVTACPHPQAAGAIGAAVIAFERYHNLLKKKKAGR